MSNNPEVLKHNPPAYIIGKQVSEGKEILVASDIDELVTVKLIEIENEWMYSNPTGMFNLSKSNMPSRTLDGFSNISYEQFKKD